MRWDSEHSPTYRLSPSLPSTDITATKDRYTGEVGIPFSTWLGPKRGSGQESNLLQEFMLVFEHPDHENVALY